MVEKNSEVSGNHQEQQFAPARSPARSAQRADGGRGRAEPPNLDAPPSNTASNNCNAGYLKALRWGVDSLYLSYPGEIFPEADASLKALKLLAQSPEAHEEAKAQIQVGEHLFEVKDKAPRLFAYVLEDNALRIQFSRSKAVPLAFVKVSSHYLAHVSPADAEKAAYDVVETFGTVSESANVSRIDLFVDFVSSADMESWDRHAWVTRGSLVTAYAVEGKFSGWSIGLGGAISCRLYNKTLEIEKSGKTWLFDLWRKVGWQEGQTVWRLEFELKREVVTQKGLRKLADVLANLNGLWSYATTEWLRLTQPNPDDQTRSRWPVHPLWAYLSSVDWETDGGPLTSRFSVARVPGDDYLFTVGFSPIISYMAREGITDFYQGCEAFITALYSYQEARSYRQGVGFDQYIRERVGIKARQFNTILNNPKQEEERQAAELAARARAYRQASEGG